MEKEFLVLGFRDFPTKDSSSEADNPYIFRNLKHAIEVADDVSLMEGCGRVVAIESIYVSETKLSKM